MNQHHQETVVLQRNCKAIFVPLGLQVNAKEGTQVTILQELGGSFTILLDGQMARVDATDADALGRERMPLPSESYDGPIDEESVTRLVWDNMRTVFDPEIPINVVDLGLVYECDISKIGKNRFGVSVKMTLTAPGCGMGDVLVADLKSKVEAVPGIDKADVELVLDPPWTQEMMSEAARLQTGMM